MKEMQTWTFFHRVDLNELVNESFDADFLSICLFSVSVYMAKFTWFRRITAEWCMVVLRLEIMENWTG